MKHILILGSGPGLSRAVACLFGNGGFSVTLVARREEKLKAEVALLQAQGIEARYRVADLGDAEALSTLLNGYRQAHSLPDVVLFNAYTRGLGGFADEEWTNLQKLMDVNVGAAFAVLKALLPAFKAAGRGCLFFTGGGFALNPSARSVGVGISKAALRNLVMAAAEDASGTGVHVATLTVRGYIGGDDPKYAPSEIARNYWTLFMQRPDEFQTEIVY